MPESKCVVSIRVGIRIGVVVRVRGNVGAWVRVRVRVRSGMEVRLRGWVDVRVGPRIRGRGSRSEVPKSTLAQVRLSVWLRMWRPRRGRVELRKRRLGRAATSGKAREVLKAQPLRQRLEIPLELRDAALATLKGGLGFALRQLNDTGNGDQGKGLKVRGIQSKHMRRMSRHLPSAADGERRLGTWDFQLCSMWSGVCSSCYALVWVFRRKLFTSLVPSRQARACARRAWHQKSVCCQNPAHIST